MRAIASVVFVAAGLGAAVSCPDTARADLVQFSNLPVLPAIAKPASMPQPDKIAATEHADGIFPALLPAARRKGTEQQGYHYVQVFQSEKEASAYSADGSLSTTPPKEGATTRRCLTSGSSLSPRLSMYVRTKPYEAPKPSAATIALLKKQHRWPPSPAKPVKKEPMKDSVVRIHAERLTQSADAVTLETQEAFLDLTTLGARSISTSSTKLTRVATGPNNLGVYAARDDKGATQFIVSNPELPPTASDEDRQAQLENLSDNAQRLVAQLPTGFSSETDCGYLRFALAAKAGSGQMATVLATAFLPPGQDADDGGEPDMSRFDGEDLSEERIKEIKDELHRENRSQRARPVAVNLSMSQLASETSPLLSVTFGWAGKDEQLRF